MLNAGTLFDLATQNATNGDNSLLKSIISEGKVSETAKKTLKLFIDIANIGINDKTLAIKAIHESISNINAFEYSSWMERVESKYKGVFKDGLEVTKLHESIHNAIIGNPIERARAIEKIITETVENKKSDLPFKPLDDPEETNFVLKYGFGDESVKNKMYESEMKNALTYMVEDLRGGVDPSLVSEALSKVVDMEKNAESIFKLYQFNKEKRNEKV